MHVSRVLDRASTHGNPVMVAVPLQWVNLPGGATCAPHGSANDRNGPIRAAFRGLAGPTGVAAGLRHLYYQGTAMLECTSLARSCRAAFHWGGTAACECFMHGCLGRPERRRKWYRASPHRVRASTEADGWFVVRTRRSGAGSRDIYARYQLRAISENGWLKQARFS